MTGRWTTKDPIRFIPRHPNLYTYVDGDPVNRTDKLGLDWLHTDTREECIAAANTSGLAGALFCAIVSVPFGEVPFVVCVAVDFVAAGVMLDDCNNRPPAPPAPDPCES